MTSRLLHRQRTLDRLNFFTERIKEAEGRKLEAMQDIEKFRKAIQII